MDIAFVTTRLVENDAQGNFSAATLAALKGRAGRVTLYAFAYERPPVEGIEVRFLGGRNGHSLKSNAAALARTLQSAKELAAFDLLVLAGPDVGALPAVHLAKRRNPRMRLFWVYHSMTPPELLPSFKERLLTRLRGIAYRMSMRRSDRVQTFSEFVKKELTDAGIDGYKIVPAPFLIDTRRFASGDRDRIRAKYELSDRFVLLYVGRLAPAKRVDRLIRAMALLKGEQVALVIVGGGPEEARLKALAAGLGVGGAVKFAGRVPDAELPDYYAACDAWATASEHEGFCVPIVEAMAAGRPVVVPDVTAMPETAGDAGLVFRPGDIDGLGRCIRAISSDRALYERLAGSARSRAGAFDVYKAMEAYTAMLTGAEAGGR